MHNQITSWGSKLANLPWRETMEEYISNYLFAGLIHPFSTHALSLWRRKTNLCIWAWIIGAYRDISVKNEYPLYSIAFAFGSLHQTRLQHSLSGLHQRGRSMENAQPSLGVSWFDEFPCSCSGLSKQLVKKHAWWVSFALVGWYSFFSF